MSPSLVGSAIAPLLGLLLALGVTSRLDVFWALTPGDPERGDLSGSGSSGLLVGDLSWCPRAPAGVSADARARTVRFAPPRAGPIAVNLGLEPRFEGLELRFRDEAGRETLIEAPAATFEAERWTLEGGVRVQGPQGLEFVAGRLAWQEGTDRLRIAGSNLPAPAGHRPRRSRETLTDLWMQNPIETGGREPWRSRVPGFTGDAQ